MTQAAIGAGQSGEAVDLGPMPVWNLADLYPSPASKTVERDLQAAAAEANRLARLYKGRLAALGKDGAGLAQAIKAYEALSDTMGKLGSCAGLLYAADTSNPANAKFYGDMQEKLTAVSTEGGLATRLTCRVLGSVGGLPLERLN